MPNKLLKKRVLIPTLQSNLNQPNTFAYAKLNLKSSRPVIQLVD